MEIIFILTSSENEELLMNHLKAIMFLEKVFDPCKKVYLMGSHCYMSSAFLSGHIHFTVSAIIYSCIRKLYLESKNLYMQYMCSLTGGCFECCPNPIFNTCGNMKL